jgi:hypothetical protein
MKEIEQINQDLEHAERILISAGEFDWADYFAKAASHFSHDPQEGAQYILGFFGGSGTVNDLVLYKDQQPMIEENDEFDRVRKRLYRLAKIVRSQPI